MAMLKVKSAFGQDLRRFTLTAGTSFDELKKKLVDIYGRDDLCIKYKDDEGDLITMTCDEDLYEAANILAKDDVIRVVLFGPLQTTGAQSGDQPEAPRPFGPFQDLGWAQFVQWKQLKKAAKAQAAKDNQEKCKKRGNPVKQMGRFVAHVTLPEGKHVEPGAVLQKVWRVRNDSDRSWPKGECNLVYVSGKSADRLSSAEVYPVEGKLAPGEEMDLTVDVTAPTAPGFYQSFWRLQGPDGSKFGQRLSCAVFVADDNGGVGFGTLEVAVDEKKNVVQSEESDGFVQVDSMEEGPEGEVSHPWEEALAKLRGMGFKNDEMSVKLLRKHNGNVEKVSAKLAEKIAKHEKKVAQIGKKLEAMVTKQTKLVNGAEADAPPAVESA